MKLKFRTYAVPLMSLWKYTSTARARVEYRLTDDGREFREIIQPLIAWSAKRDGWNSKKCPSCADHNNGYGCYCASAL